MLKRALLAVFIVTISPVFVSAQDFFFSFDENTRVFNPTISNGAATVYIFADENLSFNNLDLDFTVSGPATFIGTSNTFNDGGKFSSSTLETPNTSPPGATPPAPGTDGRLLILSLNIPALGVNVPGQVAGNLDADFRAGANAFLLAEIDFNLAGTIGETANFDLSFGVGGAVNPAGNQLAAGLTLGNGSVTVGAAAVPEPSSAVIVALSLAGMVVRRRRSLIDRAIRQA